MRALVVGGNGFIGSHLVDRLHIGGWEVTVLDLQDRRYDAMPSGVRYVRGSLEHLVLVREALMGVDVVFHLAWTTIHETSNQDPALDVLTNLIPSIRLIQACHQAGVSRIIFVSSGGTVYGVARDLPIVESHPTNPITGYGITKLAVEKYLHMYGHLLGLDYAILRPSTPYGPRQNPLARQGAVAVFLYRVAHGLAITIWGDGTTSRDFFFVSDLVDALVACAETPLDADRVFNIGGGEEVSLLQLVRLVEKTVGQRAVIEHRPARRFDASRILLDTRLAEHRLGWEPSVPMAEGLVRTWSWMSAEFD